MTVVDTIVMMTVIVSEVYIDEVEVVVVMLDGIARGIGGRSKLG